MQYLSCQEVRKPIHLVLFDLYTDWVVEETSRKLLFVTIYYFVTMLLCYYLSLYHSITMLLCHIRDCSVIVGKHMDIDID